MKEAVEYLNHSLVPIFSVDQSLYVVANQIKWNWPDTHGDDHLIKMFGGLLKYDSHEDSWCFIERKLDGMVMFKVQLELLLMIQLEWTIFLL